jgi:hypothetical protein
MFYFLRRLKLNDILRDEKRIYFVSSDLLINLKNAILKNHDQVINLKRIQIYKYVNYL